MVLRRAALSLCCTVMVGSGLALLLLGCRGNTAPSEPLLSGPQSAWPEETLQFRAVSVDADGDSLSYRFTWSGPGDTTWSGWLPQAAHCYATHVFADTGRFAVTALARDATGESGPSETLAVRVAEFGPSVPRRPAGRDTAPIGRAYNYVTTSFHPLLKDLSYRFDWGDSMGEWSGFVGSGSAFATAHAFSRAGLFEVRAQAKDARGHVSDWSEPETVLALDTFGLGRRYVDRPWFRNKRR